MKDIQKQIQELEVELKKTNNKREYIRIKAIILKLKGNSAKSISEKLDVGKSTVFAWLKAYREDSVNALQNKKRQGNHRNLCFEEEKEFLKQFEEKAESGQIVTAKEIEKAYVKLVGHSIGSGQIYRVLKRHGFRKIMPRSKHPKKASKEVIETSKKLTAEQKNLETLTRIKK
ncbi:helix-turn-helix domain-containing protein [Peptoniphilus indolicus]|uniref:Transposase and inactivated derivatives n=1 Tax=Peptoniphilus indolicus TaxID=33030 RepID=A0A379DAA1_9FIRM|nr:helix-turn-helix domain-containing protein [Peptoniphilus indolicus]SUB74465.1 Transposase and inactivated derivatives [Peptoniphilus indolicus]